MGVEVERRALLASGLLPPGVEIDLFLWGEGNSERLQMRQGLLFLAGERWGFYGRDYDYYTPYAGFSGALSMLSQCDGPQAHHGGMTSYTLEGISEQDGEQKLTFFPDPQTYRQATHEVEAFFEEVRRRVHNQLHPDAQASFQKGLRAWNEGQRELALTSMEQAYRQDPRSAMPPFYLGQLHLDKDPEKALRYLQESRQRGCTRVHELCLLLGKAYAALDDVRMAEKYVSEALSLQETPEGNALYAELMTAQGRTREALRFAHRAAALEPNDLELQALLAFCASQTGDTQTLIRCLRRVGDRIPDHPYVLVAQGKLALEQGDTEQARLLWTRALERSPGFKSAAQLLDRLPPPEPTQIHQEFASPEHEVPAEQTRLIAEPTRFHSLQEIAAKGSEGIASDETAQHSFQWKMSAYLLQRSRQLKEEWVQQFAAFALQWTRESLPLPDSVEECNLLLHSLQETFVLWLEPGVRALSHSMESDFREQWVPAQGELKSLSEAKLAVCWRQMFAALDGVMEQVFQYSLGLLDGGMFLLFLQDLMEAERTQEQAAQHLTELMTLIPAKLLQRLKQWAQQQSQEIARELNPPPPSTQEPPQGPPAPATPALPSLQRNDARARPAAPLPRIAIEQQYSSRPGPERPAKRGVDPVEKLLQEYIAAHHLLGLDLSHLNSEQMRTQLKEKLKMWEQRTGKEPDLYVRIEGGKPQIKIRPK